MGHVRKTAAGKADPPEVDTKIEAERLRIAEDIAPRITRGGLSMCLGEDSTRGA